MNEEENASKGITVAIVRHCFNCYHVLICAGTKCMFCICVHHNTVSNIKSNIRGVFLKRYFPCGINTVAIYLSIYLIIPITCSLYILLCPLFGSIVMPSHPSSSLILPHFLHLSLIVCYVTSLPLSLALSFSSSVVLLQKDPGELVAD